MRCLDEIITWFLLQIFVTRGDWRKSCLGFLPLWDALVTFVVFGCIVFWWDILMRRHSFCPLRVVVIRWYAFCCTLFARDIVMRCHGFWGRKELFVWDFTSFFLSVMLYLDEMTCFLAAEYSFWWCDVRTDGGEVEDVEGCERLSVTRWFIGRCAVFVCASWVVRWREKWM